MASNQQRKDWDRYFMDIVEQVATRATCQRIGFGVGALLVKERDIVSTGYNGSVSGDLHCVDVGCDLVDNHCQRVVHAEANAIARAAKNGVNLSGATAYITMSPCINCLRLLTSAGITKVVYGFDYKMTPRIHALMVNLATMNKLQLVKLGVRTDITIPQESSS